MGRKPVIEAVPDSLVPAADEDDDLDADDTGSDEIDVDSDNIGDVSIEINVEDLIARIEKDEKSTPPACARRKLEDYLEAKRISENIMDFEDYDLDD